MSHSEVDPSIPEKAKPHIISGYNRLMGYEVKENGQKSGGFDWYGSAPANGKIFLISYFFNFIYFTFLFFY